ncbi:MAG: PKD domain-containing protein [Gemmatimonadales bacterium]|nr:PKD domain-containing protein [Gemmatimonadales bacterium]
MKVRLALAATALLAACGGEVPTSPAPSFLVLPGENSPPTVEIVTPTEGQLFPFTSTAGAPVSLNANLADPDIGDVHTCVIDWEGATSDGVVTEADGTGTCTGSHVYATPGVYTIQVTVTDPLGESAVDSVMIVVYDPSGGFVTGGGWVIAEPGSYPGNAAATGKATFGFVAKYKKGAQVPTGNTEFQFHAVGMNFHSTDYQWLVVAGRRAQYKGTGTINGAGSYQFLLTAIDGNGAGGDGIDRLRMKIWNDDGVLFDNQQGAADGDDPAIALSGGNIVIHK